MIKLRTKDQRCVDIAREYAFQCKFLKTMIENDSEEDYLELQVPLINSYIIPKVVEFLEHYKFDKMYEIPKPAPSNDLYQMVQFWYAKFIEELDINTLTELFLASNYLDCPYLYDLTSLGIACLLKDQSPEKIRATFNIDTSSISKDDEQALRAENSWALHIQE